MHIREVTSCEPRKTAFGTIYMNVHKCKQAHTHKEALARFIKMSQVQTTCSIGVDASLSMHVKHRK
jgi:hypothetical protein